MAKKMELDLQTENLNFDETLLQCVVTNEDISLSQICEQIENEESMISSMDFLKFADEDSGNEMFGNFDIAAPDAIENSRFGEITDDEINELISNQENKNTKKNTRWAINVFEGWRKERNLCLPYVHQMADLLHMDKSSMNSALSHFVCDARKKDGSPYPPKSLYYIVCGLLRYLRDNKVHDKNFLSQNDLHFAEFRKTLDAKMKSLLAQGLVLNIKQADPITPEQEKQIWDRRVFGDHSAENLQYTMFFYMCKLFGLRAYDEYHSLECTNVVVGKDDRGKYIQFIGGASKTVKGGLAQLGIQTKNIKHYSQEGNRCIADYFEAYIKALGNSGKFYRRPLAGQPVRYGVQPIGVNKIKSFMKVICEKAKLEGNFTNHSGKRTFATQLYFAGVDEQEIMGRTGHRSEKAVRKYKRSSEAIAEKVSAVLDPPQDSTETENMEEDMCVPMKMQRNALAVLDPLRDPPCLQRETLEQEVCAPVKRALADLTNKNVFTNCSVSFNF